MFVKISHNSQENTCTRLSFLIKLERLAHVFSCEFCEISKHTVFYRTISVAASPNHGYLHCAILKALHAFQEKRDQNAIKESRNMQFFLQNVPNETFKFFKMFENNIKFTRAACWINMVIDNFGHCYDEIQKYYWKYLMLWNSTSWSRLKLTVQIQLALHPCDPFLISNRNMTGILLKNNIFVECDSKCFIDFKN